MSVEQLDETVILFVFTSDSQSKCIQAGTWQLQQVTFIKCLLALG